MAYRNLTALYDTTGEAERVAESLVSVGVSRSNIKIIANSAGDGASAMAGAAATSDYRTSTASTGTGYDAGGGFWASLKDLFLPEDESSTYAEGIRRGGTLLSASVEDSYMDAAMDVIDRSSAVDFDTRESEWRSSGWTGAPAYSEGTSMTTTGTAAGLSPASAAYGSAATTTMARATSGDSEIIPIVEEELQVGKREVERGSVRVRSYVVERPISEMVSLRDETVTIERRSVDLPVSELGADAFRERTIEMTETDEEAVVAKTARVKEELVIRKDVQQQTETISDTVRHTEVEVEDSRTAGASTTRSVAGSRS